MNAHNLLLYEVKRRGKRLEELQTTLQDLRDLETASPEAQRQLQVREVAAPPWAEVPRMPGGEGQDSWEASTSGSTYGRQLAG